MSAEFEARYGGHCHNECGNRIEAGDLVVYVDDELIHADCTPKEPVRPEAVCQSCWLTQPCDCEAE